MKVAEKAGDAAHVTDADQHVVVIRKNAPGGALAIQVAKLLEKFVFEPSEAGGSTENLAVLIARRGNDSKFP